MQFDWFTDIEEEACDGKEPLINPVTSREYDCDFQRDVCPAHSYCHKGQSFAKCCPEGRFLPKDYSSISGQ